ncbi:Hemolysin, contains CBS domains [Gracilibacillus ureilyticus]|uniref:Hemolysin, contains CBS domains n=1 Tax=Gracilibacillus ureilyticus TaxID=531814 RepID=A0A1H9SXL7_9BACI|nr:hemolysin family protein [Gracilibacillus ureilyticus]SER89661.1 Hemolysin, contains CBS domains [Gracilibacillus ureilyticus]
MDDIPLSSIIILATLIFLSAFFSSAETAFSSVNKIRLKNLVDEGRRGSKNALHMAEHFDNTLSTILIGNNIVNIAASSISATLANELFGGNMALVISTVIMTILILIFGEILPKSLAKEHAESYTLTISGILFILIKLLTPINFLFVKLKILASKLFAKNEPLPSVTEEEIKVMLDISEEEGVIDKEERQLIHRSMDFDDTIAGEILTPRIDMIAINIEQPIDEIKNIFFEERFSRIPVYEDSVDNIIGILSEKEFLTHVIKYGDVNVRELLRDPLFVVESMKISTLLPQLQKEKVHMAIVVDEFGGTSGLLTLEDVLEEIVGEIWDEQDEKTISISQINENVYKFDAQYQLDDFAEKMNVPAPDSSYHTLGGWVIENFEAIPTNGDTFHYGPLKVSVDEVTNRRVKKVKVEIQKEEVPKSSRQFENNYIEKVQ